MGLWGLPPGLSPARPSAELLPWVCSWLHGAGQGSPRLGGACSSGPRTSPPPRAPFLSRVQEVGVGVGG